MLPHDLRTIARALGGEVAGRQVLAPGPGHSRKDRSLSVRLSDQNPTGFITYSHAGDDFAVCRDYVIERLGMPADAWRRTNADNLRVGFGPEQRGGNFTPLYPEMAQVVSPAHPDDTARMARARAIWNEAGPARASLAEHYFASRGLSLALLDGVHDVLRYHSRCPWRDEAVGRTVYVPAVVAALRSIHTDQVQGAHRTRLNADGVKIDRRMLGQASGAAIKLDGDDTVTLGLHLAEGVETALAARQLGFRPCWALGSAGAIQVFPVLPSIETLTLLAENDDANRRAVDACATRWHRAGREVIVVEPTHGNDLNDAIRSAA